MTDQTKLIKILKIILQIGTAAVLFVPLIYTNSTFFPFVFGKFIIFRVLVELMIPVWFMLIILAPSHRPKRGLLFWLLAVNIIAVFASTFFGVDPARSFWGNHERMLGAFTSLHAYIYTLMIVSAYARESFKKILLVTLVVSGGEGLAYLGQLIIPGFLVGSPGPRQWGTLGNYLYLSEFFMVHLLITVYFAVHARTALMRGASWTWASVIFIILLLNTSRSTFIGFMFGVLIVGVLFLIWGKGRRARGLAVGAIAFVFAVGGFFYAFQGSPVLQKSFLLQRLSNISATSGTAQTRFIAWHIAWQAFLDKPVLGWGPENYYYAFNLHFNPKSLEHSYYETWFDRPHNIFLEVLSTGGAVGIITYLAFPLVAVFLLIRRIRKYPEHLKESAILITLILIPMIIKGLVFEHAASMISGPLIAAWAMAVLGGDRKKETATAGTLGLSLATGIVSAIAIIFVVFYANLQAWAANVQGLRAAQTMRVNPTLAFELYQEALQIKNPYQSDVQMAIARDYLESASTGRLPGELMVAGGLRVADTLKKNLAAHPHDVFTYLILGQVYTVMGSADAKYLDDAERVFAQGIQYSPTRQQYLYSWGRMRMLKKDIAGAKELFGRARDLDPNIADSYWLLALAANEEKDIVLSKALVRQAVNLFYEWKSPNEALYALQLFKDDKDPEILYRILSRAVGVFPDRAQFHLFFAQVLGMLGKREEAEKEAARAAELDPSLRSPIQGFLQQLNAR